MVEVFGAGGGVTVQQIGGAQPGLWVTSEGELVGRFGSLGDALRRVAELEQKLEDAVSLLLSERRKVRELSARLREDRTSYDRYDEVMDIIREWSEVMGKPRSRWSNDRFDRVRDLLEVTKPAPYPREAFSLAFAGAKYDPYVTRRKNGTVNRHDDIAWICRSGEAFEEYILKAPRGSA